MADNKTYKIIQEGKLTFLIDGITDNGKPLRFRSRHETKTYIKLIKQFGFDNVIYKKYSIVYHDNEKVWHTYTPDFVLFDRRLIIETRGYLSVPCQQKYIAIQRQYPQLKMFFWLLNPNSICKDYLDSYTEKTVRDWFNQHGYKRYWSAGDTIPVDRWSLYKLSDTANILLPKEEAEILCKIRNYEQKKSVEGENKI